MNISGIIIYPNPTNDGNFIVKSLEGEILQTNIFNSGGHLVYSNSIVNSMSQYVELSNGKGVYFVQVVLNDKVLTKKIIISR